jgi:hypothetical protein
MSVESVLARVGAIEQALSNPASLMAASTRTGGTAAPVEAAAEPTAPTGGPSFAEILQSAGAGTATNAGAGTAATTSPGTSPGMATASVSDPITNVAALAPATGAVGAVGAMESMDQGALAPVSATAGAPESMGRRIVAIAESQIGQTEQPPGSNESPAIAAYRTATAGAVPGAPWCAYFASWAARQAGEPLGMSGEGLGSVGQIWSWAQSTARAIPNGPGVTPQPGDLIVFGDEHVGIVKGVLPNGDIQTIEGNYENKVSANVRTPTEATGYVNMS